MEHYVGRNSDDRRHAQHNYAPSAPAPARPAYAKGPGRLRAAPASGAGTQLSQPHGSARTAGGLNLTGLERGSCFRKDISYLSLGKLAP